MGYRIENRMGVRASSLRLWEVLAEVAAWPQWAPLYPAAEGVIGLNKPLRLTEAVPGLPPREATVTVTDYTPEQQLIWRDRRGLLANSLRYFEIEALAENSCVLANGEIFSGLLGERWGLRNRRALLQAYEDLNAALKARAEG